MGEAPREAEEKALPIHRMTPFDGLQVESQRTILFWIHGERHLYQGDWMTGAIPPVLQDEVWVGYTFFRDIQPAGTGATQETLTSQSSSSNPRTTDPSSSTLTSRSSGPPPMPKAMVSGSSRSSSTAQTSSTGQTASTPESAPPETELIREVRYM